MINKDRTRNWIDSLAKILPGIGAMIAGIFIPMVIHINSERSRSSQLYTEILSKREMADSDLRAKMFETLIKCFFGDTNKPVSPQETLILMRLLALNFHESFDLKPLFEGLAARIKNEEKEELINIAQEIVGKQEAMLSTVEEGMVFDEILHESEENGIMVPPEGKDAYKGHRIGIVVTEIKKGDYARLCISDFPEENKNIGETANVEFKLSHFDMPFIDNIKLFNSTRFAVTLKGFSSDKTDAEGRTAVNIKIIFFSENYMSSRDRPYLDEMLRQLRG